MNADESWRSRVIESAQFESKTIVQKARDLWPGNQRENFSPPLNIIS